MNPSSLLLALALTACAPAEFQEASIQVHEDGSVSGWMGGGAEPPCPVLEEPVQVVVNGVAGSMDSLGGEGEEWQDEEGNFHVDCDGAYFGADAVPLDTGDLLVEIAADNADFRMQTPWPALVDVWTSDDIVAAEADGLSFDIHWTPDDAEVSNIGVHEDPDVPIGEMLEQVDAGPGWARYRFIGIRPREPWTVRATVDLERTADCDLDRCAFRAPGRYGVDLIATRH